MSVTTHVGPYTFTGSSYSASSSPSSVPSSSLRLGVVPVLGDDHCDPGQVRPPLDRDRPSLGRPQVLQLQ